MFGYKGKSKASENADLLQGHSKGEKTRLIFTANKVVTPVAVQVLSKKQGTWMQVDYFQEFTGCKVRLWVDDQSAGLNNETPKYLILINSKGRHRIYRVEFDKVDRSSAPGLLEYKALMFELKCTHEITDKDDANLFLKLNTIASAIER